MTLVKFPQRSFEQTFNNLVGDFFAPASSLIKNDVTKWQHQLSVPVNIRKNETGYELEVVAPGLEKEAFRVDVDKNLLTISAEVKKEEENEKEQTLRKEFVAKSFQRSFTLNENIDADNISARYHNGILVLNLPEKVAVKEPVKQIAVQ